MSTRTTGRFDDYDYEGDEESDEAGNEDEEVMLDDDKKAPPQQQQHAKVVAKSTSAAVAVAGMVNDPADAFWMAGYKRLCEFHAKKGHCRVPYSYKTAAKHALGRWVGKQRERFGLGKLQKDRIHKLKQIGFVWSMRDWAWEGRFKDLQTYKRLHGHCKLTMVSNANRGLGTWIKQQRRDHARFLEGQSCSPNMAERIEKLNTLGFQWRVSARTPKPTKQKSESEEASEEDSQESSEPESEEDSDEEASASAPESDEDEDDDQKLPPPKRKRQQFAAVTPSPKKPAVDRTMCPSPVASRSTEFETGDSRDHLASQRALVAKVRKRNMTSSTEATRAVPWTIDLTTDSDDEVEDTDACQKQRARQTSPPPKTRPAVPSAASSAGVASRQERTNEVGSETTTGPTTKNSLLVSLKAYEHTCLNSADELLNYWDVHTLIQHLEKGTTSVPGPNASTPNKDGVDSQGDADTPTVTALAVSKQDLVGQLEAYKLVSIQSSERLVREQAVDVLALFKHLQGETTSWQR